MSEVKVTVLKDGPYKVEGPISMKDHEENQIEVPSGKAVALCRCGASTNKPFCDGTHSKIGFEGAKAAVEAHRKG